MRDHINSLVGKVMIVVSPEQEEYVFKLKKKFNKTRIFGPGYMKLLNDYDMKSGDRIRFELDHPTAFVPIFPEGADDAPKQRVKGTFYANWFSNLSSVVSCFFSLAVI